MNTRLVRLYPDAMIDKIALDIDLQKDNKEAIAYAVRFMKACCQNPMFEPKSTLPKLLQWGVELDDKPLRDAAIRIGKTMPNLQSSIVERIKADYSRMVGTRAVGPEDWDQW